MSRCWVNVLAGVVWAWVVFAGGYTTDADKPAPPCQPVVDARAALLQGLPRDVRRQQARERLVLLMVNESAAILGAGLIATAQELDLGQSQLVIQSLPEPVKKTQVSTGGSSVIRWRRDGKELYYLAPA